MAGYVCFGKKALTMKYPTISIVTCLYNPDYDVFRQMLQALRSQKYPMSKIEHIIMDGGSERKYIQLAKGHNTKIFIKKNLLNDALKRSKIAIEKARGEVILFLEPDNIICGKNWLEEMVQPFLDDPTIVGTFSMYNSYSDTMPALTRYTALLGVNDPTVYYLKKSEKLAAFETSYTNGFRMSDATGYVTQEFNPSNLPVLGDNGHMVRRKIISPIAKKMKTFLHTDAFMIACKHGHVRYGIVRNSIVHHTGSNIIDFFRRRTTYMLRYNEKTVVKREYKVFDVNSSTDRKNIFLFVFYSLTFLQPFSLSLRGFIRKPDSAWFLHPIICVLAVFAYGFSTMRKLID